MALWQASGAAAVAPGRLSRRGSFCRRSSHRCDVLPIVMRVLGLVFAGTATDNRAEMTAFARDVLGLQGLDVQGASADMFALPDGSVLAVAGPRELGETSRSLGFLVADLEEAIAYLQSAGVEVDEIAENQRFRYVHFRAPDGALYELVEEINGR